MVQQMQMPCDSCRGEGTTISAKDRCTKCSGERIAQEKRTIDVHIEKGMSNGEKIKFSEEGDQAPDVKPGDVYIVLQEQKHDKFVRKGTLQAFAERTRGLGPVCGRNLPV